MLNIDDNFIKYFVFSVTSKTKSIVWKYFVRTEIGGTCKMCQTEIKTGGNTTNLRNHLKRKHEKTLRIEEIKEINKMSENLKKPRLQCEIVILNFMTTYFLNIFLVRIYKSTY